MEMIDVLGDQTDHDNWARIRQSHSTGNRKSRIHAKLDSPVKSSVPSNGT